VPFVLLLPQQREANNEQRCFNFFRDEDNRPGLGESGSIRNMIAHAVETYAVDPNRVHVLGLSAGGAMTAVMLANYPELFAGGAILAGAPFDCNRPTTWNYGVWWWLRTFVGEAAAASFACGILGPSATDRSAGNWGEAVRAISEATPERWPRVSIWHGDADDVVDPANRRELVEQWTNVHGIDAEPDDSRTQGDVVHEVFTDDAGVALVEAWRLIDFPHAVAIDPDAEPVACGVAAEFIEPAGICSIRRIASFWGLLP
jgi:poly(3-hydroxybutyrate) depolymerase